MAPSQSRNCSLGYNSHPVQSHGRCSPLFHTRQETTGQQPGHKAATARSSHRRPIKDTAHFAQALHAGTNTELDAGMLEANMSLWTMVYHPSPRLGKATPDARHITNRGTTSSYGNYSSTVCAWQLTNHGTTSSYGNYSSTVCLGN